MRPRRPASPRALRTTPDGHLDADEKRALAASGDFKRTFTGTNQAFSGGEWRLLTVLLFLAFFIRLFRLSQPDSVV